MAERIVQADVHVEGRESIENALKRPARELMLYRLRCPRTANGLSHYYTYGDLH